VEIHGRRKNLESLDAATVGLAGWARAVVLVRALTEPFTELFGRFYHHCPEDSSRHKLKDPGGKASIFTSRCFYFVISVVTSHSTVCVSGGFTVV
jgi:hypothetical protein